MKIIEPNSWVFPSLLTVYLWLQMMFDTFDIAPDFYYYCEAQYTVARARVLVDILFMLILNKPLTSLLVNGKKQNKTKHSVVT